MKRRAKHKIARWAGPVLGSLLLGGCGTRQDGPAPRAQTTQSISVAAPQIQEFGVARPLGADDYRSASVAQTQYSVPECGAGLPPSQAVPASAVACRRVGVGELDADRHADRAMEQCCARSGSAGCFDVGSKKARRSRVASC